MSTATAKDSLKFRSKEAQRPKRALLVKPLWRSKERLGVYIILNLTIMDRIKTPPSKNGGG